MTEPSETEEPSGAGQGAAATWDERYRSTDRLFRADPDETLVELVSSRRPGRALDLGAGEGRNSLWLAQLGWSVVAVDASAVALGRLNEAAGLEGVRVDAVAGDVFDFLSETRSRGERFDLVVVAFLQFPRPERRVLLEAAAAVVAPGGGLFVVAHHLASLGVSGPPDPERLYTEDDLVEAASGLRSIRLEQRRGPSDIAAAGVDVLLFAELPPTT